MLKSRLISVGALALVAAAGPPLRAQSTTQVQLAFGYECGDRFMVRNEGAQPVLIEYGMTGSQDRSQLHLSAQQSAEIASAQNGNMELWVGGKVVASEPKGNTACGAQNGVTVRPLNQADATTSQQSDATYTEPPVVVYAPPASDYYYYPYSDPYYYPYAYYGFGYYPYYYPSVSVYARGGFGRVGRVGGGVRGRGGRR